MVADGRIHVSMSQVTSHISIEADVTTEQGCATVIIRGAHTNIVEIRVNGQTVFKKEEEHASAAEDGGAEIHKYTLAQLGPICGDGSHAGDRLYRRGLPRKSCAV